MLRIFQLFVVTSLLYGASIGHPVETPTSRVITWIRKFGNTSIHESVVVDDKEQTVLMISPEAYKNDKDNSLALHDFQTGQVAFLNFKTDTCFVGEMPTRDFQSMKTILENMEGKELPAQEVKQAQVTTKLQTSSDLGPRLSSLCKGIPVYRFIWTETDVQKRERRFSAMACPTKSVQMTMPKELNPANAANYA